MNVRAQGPSGTGAALNARCFRVRFPLPSGSCTGRGETCNVKMKSSVLSVLTIVMCAVFSTELTVATERNKNVTGKFWLADFFFPPLFVV